MRKDDCFLLFFSLKSSILCNLVYLKWRESILSNHSDTLWRTDLKDEMLRMYVVCECCDDIDREVRHRKLELVCSEAEVREEQEESDGEYRKWYRIEKHPSPRDKK
jgi:hypothetical protein